MQTSNAAPGTDRDGPAERPAAWHTWAFAAFCLALVLIRILFARSLGPGDAAEHYLSQTFALSYGIGNPPLHTWLFIGFERLLGPGLATSLLLDVVLLVIAFASVLRTGRFAGLTPGAAAAGAWSVLLVPPFVGALSDGVESAALLCLTALTLEAAVRVNDRHGTRDYVRLGFLLAVGTLTKYVFILVPATLAVSVLAVTPWRRRWVHAELVYTLLPAMLLWPVATGILDRVEPELASLAAGRSALEAMGIATLGAGLLSFGQGVLVYAAPLALGVVITRPWRHGRVTLPTGAKFLGHFVVAGLVLSLLAVMVAGLSEVEPGDLNTVMLPLPLLAAAWVARTGRVPGIYRAAVVVFAVALLGRTAWNVSPACPGECGEMIPYHVLAEAIGPLPEGATIVASDLLTAGNLRVLYPSVRIVAATYRWEPARPESISACVAVVDPRLRPATPPTELLDFHPDTRPAATITVEGSVPGRETPYRWQVLRVADSGACP